MVMACDGVWDVVSSQTAVGFIRERLGPPAEWAQRLSSGELELSGILEELLDHCLSPDLDATDGLGGDNMTAVLVLFLPQVRPVQQTRLASPQLAPAVGQQMP